MINNYLKIAIRNLLRSKVYSIINILGLALASSCALIIGLYVFDELSFDNFHNDVERIYKISASLEQDERIETGLTSVEVGPNLLSENDFIINQCRVMAFNYKEEQITTDRDYYFENIIFTDSSFFNVFNFKLISGNKNNQLSQPNTIVLSESTAKTLFNQTDAIGKKLKIRDGEYLVTGIVQDPPRNTDIQYSALISFNSFPEEYYKIYVEDWFRLATYTFLKTNEVISQDKWKFTFNKLVEDHIQSFIDKNGLNGSISYSATPITDIHFDNSKEYDSPKGNLAFVLIFGFVALLILIIACINYVNLSLARFSKRLKEIGVRKTLGATKANIVFQFLFESFLLSFVAILLSLMFAEWFIPVFSNITGKTYLFTELFSFNYIFLILALWIFVAIVGGFYPAMVHSNFLPVNVFKGGFTGFANVGIVRKILVTVQFTFTIALIAAAFIVYQQINFIQNADLGYHKENIMVFDLPSDSVKIKKMPEFISQIESVEGVKTISFSNSLPNGKLSEILFRVEDKEGLLKEQGVKCFFVDYKYADLLGLKILEGRNFDAKLDSNEKETFIVNHKALEVFGWGKSGVGKRIQWGLMADDKAAFDGKVIGVFNDFNFTSLHKEIEPLVFILIKNPQAYLNIRITGKNQLATIKNIEYKWQQIYNSQKPKWNFLDKNLAKLYFAELRTFKVLIAFAIFSLIIACLGLFALTSFLVEQKTKEIGIRKVLGASYWNNAALISKGYFGLLLISVFIAIPVGYFILNKWLISFAYKIEINPIWFVIAVFVATLLSSFAIFYHVYKVTNNNPIKALRFS